MTTPRTPRYGRKLDDFAVGETYAHPWEVTIDAGTIALFQASFLDATPTYASATFARQLGFRDRPVHPLLLLNFGLSFSVHDVSEQAIAHLAYLDVRFPAAAYPGDTVRAHSEVLGVKPASSGDRGVVHVRTTLANQHAHPICIFERKALVRSAPNQKNERERAATTSSGENPASTGVPSDLGALAFLRSASPPLTPLPGVYEDFAPGDVILHQTGKTIGESEHMQLTSLVRNTHPLHFDEHYADAEGQSFAKTRVVYGGLVLAWTASLASRDVAGNAWWEVSLDDGAHPSGVLAGDTLYAASRVEATRELDAHWGEVTFRLVGVKNTRPDTLLTAGHDLFEPELKKDKSAKISAKVVEITRTLLVRRR